MQLHWLANKPTNGQQTNDIIIIRRGKAEKHRAIKRFLLLDFVAPKKATATPIKCPKKAKAPCCTLFVWLLLLQIVAVDVFAEDCCCCRLLAPTKWRKSATTAGSLLRLCTATPTARPLGQRLRHIHGFGQALPSAPTLIVSYPLRDDLKYT